MLILLTQPLRVTPGPFLIMIGLLQMNPSNLRNSSTPAPSMRRVCNRRNLLAFIRYISASRLFFPATCTVALLNSPDVSVLWQRRSVLGLFRAIDRTYFCFWNVDKRFVRVEPVIEFDKWAPESMLSSFICIFKPRRLLQNKKKAFRQQEAFCKGLRWHVRTSSQKDKISINLFTLRFSQFLGLVQRRSWIEDANWRRVWFLIVSPWWQDHEWKMKEKSPGLALSLCSQQHKTLTTHAIITCF